jgi:non-specific serine/threonine protein kinase/serine/threonine-protein kinase
MSMYNLGCLAALRGDRKLALDWLGQAVGHGWRGADGMAEDSDLKSLRGDPRFEALVARTREDAARSK